MSIYDPELSKGSQGERSFNGDGAEPAAYRLGWIWIPVAVMLLLTILVVATGFVYGGYSDRTRGYDNGTALEQTGGDTTMPRLATSVANPAAPERGAVDGPSRPVVRPEEAPPLANDGQ